MDRKKIKRIGEETVNLINIAEKIAKTCKDNGIHVLRYDATSSNSIYLKFDYGIANSLRISDHRGEKYLKYKYNIMPSESSYTIKNPFPRYYYGTSDENIDDCIRKILSERNKKIRKYGINHYKTLVLHNKTNGQDTKWARVVAV